MVVDLQMFYFETSVQNNSRVYDRTAGSWVATKWNHAKSAVLGAFLFSWIWHLERLCCFYLLGWMIIVKPVLKYGSDKLRELDSVSVCPFFAHETVGAFSGTISFFSTSLSTSLYDGPYRPWRRAHFIGGQSAIHLWQLHCSTILPLLSRYLIVASENASDLSVVQRIIIKKK